MTSTDKKKTSVTKAKPLGVLSKRQMQKNEPQKTQLIGPSEASLQPVDNK